MVHRAILETENFELNERVRGVERLLASLPPNESLTSLQSAMAVYDVSHGGKWLQVIGQDGSWVHRSKVIASIFPTLALPQQLGNGEHFFEFTDGASHVRGLITGIQVQGRSYTVQTGMTLNKTQEALGNYRLHLMVLTPIILLAAGVVGYFASYKALSPVASITSEARRISSQNLDARLPLLRTHDELAELSETLNQMLDRIDAGYRSVKEFTANAAHELRTPLTLIRTEAEIALAFERSALENRDALEHIRKETIRMGKLTDDLLMLARYDAGAQAPQFELLDLNEVVRSSAERWSSQLQNSGLQLCVSTTDEDATIFADRSSIDWLLDILLENAQKYSPCGGQIKLSTSALADDVVLSVADTGIGISSEHQDRIFERFYRVDQGSNGGAEVHNSGLGLALAQRIAESHGGTIKVQSELGKGSCFLAKFKLANGSLKNTGSNCGVDVRTSEKNMSPAI